MVERATKARCSPGLSAVAAPVVSPVVALEPRRSEPDALTVRVDIEDGDPGAAEREMSAVAQQLVLLARAVVDERIGIRLQLHTSVAQDAGEAPGHGCTSHTYAFRSAAGQTGRLTLWGAELDPTRLPAQLERIAELAESYLVLLGRAHVQSRVISELEHTVSHDPLTGAVTRILLEDRLRHAQAAASRDRRDIGLIYLDLDDFKGVNDRHGHVAGDELLIAVVRRVIQAVRPADTVARVGGDEFLIVCEAVGDWRELRRVVERIERSVERPYRLPGAPQAAYQPAVSVGATLLAPAEDVDGAVRRADAAMYANKRRRRRARGETLSGDPRGAHSDRSWAGSPAAPR
jgi:diguanylate cyclase (GGDEF)-like protein